MLNPPPPPPPPPTHPPTQSTHPPPGIHFSPNTVARRLQLVDDATSCTSKLHLQASLAGLCQSEAARRHRHTQTHTHTHTGTLCYPYSPDPTLFGFSASYAGGAVLIGKGGIAIFTRSQFIGNEVTGRGGAPLDEATDGDFIGGALVMEGGASYGLIAGCVFIGNYALRKVKHNQVDCVCVDACNSLM